MVRAMLAQIGGCPIVGDVRYAFHNDKVTLQDQSVALHAYRVTLDASFQLGSQLTTHHFEAPIPDTWKEYFNVIPESIPNGVC